MVETYILMYENGTKIPVETILRKGEVLFIHLFL
jgi:hypothetical protein